ncbi:MAG: sialate O-acetylesterase [Planctomycetota bacterium]
MIRPTLALFLAALSCELANAGELRLPSLFSDGAVLQQRATVAVWGWAEPGDEVSVSASWSEDGGATVVSADANGRWTADVTTPTAGGPHRLEITCGDETATVDDVLVGEVWLCSGQSNMEWTLDKTIEATRRDADLPPATLALERQRIRFFDVPRTAALSPQPDVDALWWNAHGEDTLRCSAVAYFFAARLQDDLDVPVGLVVSAWGGTTAQAWMSRDIVSGFPDHAAAIERAVQADNGEPPSQRVPASLYNGMIEPLAPYGIRGVIWYQGESNRIRAQEYRTLFPALIVNWRERWGNDALPFHCVQLAPFDYGEGDAGDLTALVREAQQHASDSLPHVGLALTADVGNPGDIHPLNKWAVGDRLARLALVDPYGVEGIVSRGPAFRRAVPSGRELRIEFDHVHGGLALRGESLDHFEVAGADGAFVPARARIAEDGESVVLTSLDIDAPTRARYLWNDAAEATLMSVSGLPAAPFRTR